MNEITLLLVAGFINVCTFVLGWYLNGKSRTKEMKRQIISENRIKWIEIFRQEISELMFNLDKLGKFTILKSAQRKGKLPATIAPDKVNQDYDETLEKVALLINKTKFLLSLDHEEHQEVFSALLDLRDTLSKIDIDTISKEELDKKYNILFEKCHIIIQFERYMVEDEIEGK